MLCDGIFVNVFMTLCDRVLVKSRVPERGDRDIDDDIDRLAECDAVWDEVRDMLPERDADCCCCEKVALKDLSSVGVPEGVCERDGDGLEDRLCDEVSV